MEFRFDVNDIFKQPIIEIGHTLIPAGFKGDRRQLWDTISKVTDVINAMGTASANAQGLSKAITTPDRLRNSEQTILYLLIDAAGNQGKGAVTGMLKTGRKGLYVFDRDGHHFQVQAPCILDFYVHESRQRAGLGKKLFEYMLQREEVEPKRLAIDRPSDKFLAFLNKHYALTNPIRQMNNFVVYDGFFPGKDEDKQPNKEQQSQQQQQGESPHRGSNGLQGQILTSPYGRYGARRPPCSMGQIIHNQSATVTGNEQTGAINTFPQYNQIPAPYVPDQNAIIPPTQSIEQQQQQAGAETSETKEENAVIGDSTSNNNVKIQKVGNGLPYGTDDERMTRLKRDEIPAAAVYTQPKTDYHWPFAVPSQDYVYERRFRHRPTSSVTNANAGMQHLLQPEQYMQEKQRAPAKEDVDEQGRPKSLHSVHAGQQQQRYHVPQALQNYNYFAQRPASAHQLLQHQQQAHEQFEQMQAQQAYLEQVHAQQQYLQQLQAQQQQLEQQQMMWDQYQYWLQQQYLMQQYPQWYTPTQEVAPEQPQAAAAAQPEALPEVVQPETAGQPMTVQPEAVAAAAADKPESLIPARVTPAQEAAKTVAPKKSKIMTPEAPLQPVAEASAATAMPYMFSPLPTPNYYPGYYVNQAMPASAVVGGPQQVEAGHTPMPSPVQSVPLVVPSVHQLTSEQLAQLSPQQQIMHYQQMLAQPTYLQHGMPYTPYNRVFGIPPQPMAALAPQAVAATTVKDARQEERHEVAASEGAPGAVAEDARAAGDAQVASTPALTNLEKPAAPCPYPILLKSKLEPLQASVPLRRHSKPDVPVQSAKSKNRVQQTESGMNTPYSPQTAKTNTSATGNCNTMSTLVGPVAGQAVRVASSAVNHGGRPAKLNERNVNNALRRATSANVGDNGGNAPSASQHMMDNKELLRKRSAIISEFLERLQS